MKLESLVKFGISLLSEAEIDVAHDSFNDWVESGAAYLDEQYPGSGLSAEWASLGNSRLFVGNRTNSLDEKRWIDFHAVVEKRLAWLGTLSKKVDGRDQVALSEENAPPSSIETASSIQDTLSRQPPSDRNSQRTPWQWGRIISAFGLGFTIGVIVASVLFLIGARPTKVDIGGMEFVFPTITSISSPTSATDIVQSSPTKSTAVSFPSSETIFTLTPASISELEWCNIPGDYFPCRYRIKNDDYAEKVATLIYQNESLAGRINELYRTKTGKISSYNTDDQIVLPDRNAVQNEDYYRYYFQIIVHPISQCQGATFSFPCWYVSQGESYNALMKKYPRLIPLECIEAANRVTYDKGSIITKPTEVGAIIVLPVCP